MSEGFVTIDTPDGPLDFPDTMTDDQIKAALRKLHPLVLKDPSKPASQQEMSDITPPTKPVSQALGFQENLKRPWNNAAIYTERGLKSMGVPTDRINSFLGTPNSEQAKASDEAEFAKQEETYTPGGYGKTAGSIAADIPAIALTKNPYIIGGQSGLLNSEAKEGRGVVADTAMGAGLGKAGDTVVRGAGATIAPVWRDSVNEMLKSKVALLPGQIIGGFAHRAEDAIKSFPLIGDLVQSAQNRGNVSFNRGFVNKAIEPLEKLVKSRNPNAPSLLVPESVKDGFGAIAHGQDVLKKSYDAIEPHLNVNVNVPGDPFNTEVAKLTALVGHMPNDYVKSFNRILKDEVRGRMSPTGTLTGKALGEAKETINKEILTFSKGATTPRDRQYAEALTELRSQLMEMAARQNPRAAETLRALDEGYVQLAVAERAVAPAKRGVATSDNLRQASLKEDYTRRQNVSARGTAHQRAYAEAAADTLAPTINDSGTVTRGMVNGLFGAGVAGASYAAPAAVASVLNPYSMGAAGLVALPYTKTGGAIVRGMMSPRNQFMPARRALQSVAPLGAAAASSSRTHVTGDE